MHRGLSVYFYLIQIACIDLTEIFYNTSSAYRGSNLSKCGLQEGEYISLVVEFNRVEMPVFYIDTCN